MQLLYLHNDFYVCDMVSGIRCLGHESESDSVDSDIRDESIKNLTSIEASPSNGISNERFEVKRNNQQWFQPEPNSLYERNKSTKLFISI